MTLPYTLEDHLPSAGDVGAIFADEVAALGGTVVDVVEQCGWLFGRALIGDSEDVTPGDTIYGGVGIHVHGPEVRVHGYTHRKVCSNGAMGVVPGEVFRVERAPAGTPVELVTSVHASIRAAVRQCVGSPTFFQAIVRMRLATEVEASQSMYALPQLLLGMAVHAPPAWREQVLREVMQRHMGGRDRSLFGLLNAVTSTARDEEDPARRWALEELGGQVLVGGTRARRVQAGRAPVERAAVRREVEVLAGAGATGT